LEGQLLDELEMLVENEELEVVARGDVKLSVSCDMVTWYFGEYTMQEIDLVFVSS